VGRVATIDHRTRELIDPSGRIWHDLRRICCHSAQSVDIPPSNVRIVMEELDLLPWHTIPIIRVNEPSALRGRTGRVHVRATWLNGEVHRHVDIARQWERRSVDRNRCNADLTDDMLPFVCDRRPRWQVK